METDRELAVHHEGNHRHVVTSHAIHLTIDEANGPISNKFSMLATTPCRGSLYSVRSMRALAVAGSRGKSRK